MANMEVDDAYDDVSVGELFGEDNSDDEVDEVDVLDPIAALVRGAATGATNSVLERARMDWLVQNDVKGLSADELVARLRIELVKGRATIDKLEELHQRLNERVEGKIPLPQPEHADARNEAGVVASSIIELRMQRLVETNLKGVSDDCLTKSFKTVEKLKELHQRLNERVKEEVPLPELEYKIGRNERGLLVKSIEHLRLQRIKEEQEAAARPDEEVAAIAAKRKRKAKALPQPELTKKVKVISMPGARQQALLYLAEDEADYHRLAARYEAGDKALKKDVSLAMVARAEPPEDKPEEVEKAVRQTLLYPVGKLADNMTLERNRALYEQVEKPSNGDATHIYWAANADAHDEFDAFKFKWSEASKLAFLGKFVSLTWDENPDNKDKQYARCKLCADQMMLGFSTDSHSMHALVVQKVRAAFVEKHYEKLLQRLAACLKDAPTHQREAVLEAIEVKITNQFGTSIAEHLTLNEKRAAYESSDDTLKKHIVVHRAVGLKLKDFPELLQWALETISMDAVKLKGRREAYRSTETGSWRDEVRKQVDAWLRQRESIPAPKCKLLNGEVCRPLGERAKETAAEAAAEREEAVQEKRKKHAAARAQIEEDYPHFGKYAFEVFSEQELAQKEKAAKAVVARMMRATMEKVRHYAQIRARCRNYLAVECDAFHPQGAEFSDDEGEDARASAKRARRERALYSAPVREPAPRSPSPVRETCPSKIAAIEEQMDRLAKQPRRSSMTEHEKANVQKLIADLERRLPKGHKRKAADALDVAGR